VGYDEYKNRLGNLTLLEKPINIVAGNDFFSKKCNEYKKSKYYLTSSIPALTTVGNNTSINRINEAFMFELHETDESVTEFGSKLWTAVIDSVLVRKNGRLLFRFRNGMEVEG
jgi:hypothetical protein